MPLFETLTLELGPAIAKTILMLWLKDPSIAGDLATDVATFIKSKTSDVIAQQRGKRQFEEIGERVAENLLPVFEIEGEHLDEGSRVAVVLAVATTLRNSPISSELLANQNLESTRLLKHLISIYPDATQHFSAVEATLYTRIMSEASQYIVDIASQLPNFTERTLAEVLKRESQLLAIANQILEEVRRIQTSSQERYTKVAVARFETEYRRAVVRRLDELELFGADVSSASRRHRLSVAYVTLSVEQKVKSTSGKALVWLDKALPKTRCLLVRGLAGSGKTTLLKWIAVRAASQTFEGQLASWNTSIPFFISLRQCGEVGLLAPEDFARLTVPAIAGLMPNGWVHDLLYSGRAIVLVDGVDEVSTVQRIEVRKWLKIMVETFTQAHFIVTSRPYAVGEEWLVHEGFDNADLQPMELPGINAFIDHWHSAVAEEVQEEQKAEMMSLTQNLKGVVRQNTAIRNLATNPLLCAMLCALHRDRRQQLPSDRIELYEACTHMLLERRDIERRVDLGDYPRLSYRQKRALLQDLAYWMLRNGWTSVSEEKVDSCLDRRLSNMEGIPQDSNGAYIRRLFIERSGILREHVPMQIDFAHRTFQEFLAAQGALDEGDTGVLVHSAHNDQWRETIILAAGLASLKVRGELIKGIIDRGDKETRERYQLHLLAIACLETSVELDRDVKQELEQRLKNLIPPKNSDQVNILTSAGELAIRYLVANDQYSTQVSIACIKALAGMSSETAFNALVSYIQSTEKSLVNTLLGEWDSQRHRISVHHVSAYLQPSLMMTPACIRFLVMIGDEVALRALEEYSIVPIQTIVDELFIAWDSFDRKEYARRVLARVSEHNEHLVLGQVSSINGIEYLTGLKSLTITSCDQISDLQPLERLINLTSLTLGDCKQVTDLSPLAQLTNLTELEIWGCVQLTDISPLAGLVNLTKLTIWGCSEINDFNLLLNLPNLYKLALSGCKCLTNFELLARLNNLTELTLWDCQRVTNISQLEGLTKLTELTLAGCDLVNDLSSLANLTNLSELTLWNCKHVVDLRPLASLVELTSLNITSCERVNDLSTLSQLTKLAQLTLDGCSHISDLRPIAVLKNLAELTIGGCKSVSDLSPLAELINIQQLFLSDLQLVYDLDPLASLIKLEELSIAGAGQLRELSPLSELPVLRCLCLLNCEQLSDLKPLTKLRSLYFLDLRGCEKLMDLNPLKKIYNLQSLLAPSHINEIPPELEENMLLARQFGSTDIIINKPISNPTNSYPCTIALPFISYIRDIIDTPNLIV